MDGLIVVAIPVDTQEQEPADAISTACEAVGTALIAKGFHVEVIAKRFADGEGLANNDELSANDVDRLGSLGFNTGNLGLSNTSEAKPAAAASAKPKAKAKG